MAKRIDFLHPEFHKGINSTVRLGNKKDLYYVGQFVGLYKTGEEEPSGYAVVTNVRVKPYNDLTETDIKYQHDAETQTLSGLWEAMTKAYGEKITPESTVTIVYFETE
jgi:hypothetical protein